MTFAVEVSDLHKSYGDHAVLRGVDLAVPRGTVCALLGPNGAGKTTLVRILATLLAPDRGRVHVDGFDVVREHRAVRGLVGLTGQYASVDELLTGRENLVLLGRLLHLGRPTARRRAAELLDELDLADAADRRVGTYSGGMRRRLDLAASLVGRPPIVFLDEPTTGLDPRARRDLWTSIRAMVADGVTVLLTTQYLDEADALADAVAVLHDGRVVTEGTAAALKQRVGSERLTLEIAPRDLDRAAALLAASDPVVDPGQGTIAVALGATDELRRVLNTLADAAVAVAGVRLSAPTLDDVFFSVTGAEAA